MSGGVGERCAGSVRPVQPNGRLRQFGVVKLEARLVVQVLARLVPLKGVQVLLAVLRRVDEVGLHWQEVRGEKEKCETLKVRNER